MPKVIITKSLVERLKALLIKWICDINVLFLVIKHFTFYKLLALLNFTVMKEVLLESYNMIKKWLKELYRVNKAVLRKKMAALS